ncbi:GTPase Era [Conexibacter sp. CPCC 206217]|uniref:GTPase Era n=1 Tax=Conexibacter sp. CPCC 206217 TaxID=3064574 RepID=UPI002721ABA4|nr:GTPase Era [Conexibacter sp. CPCC 206217]MDO8210981.1 GTPase Era [Conexibacter sp. CPCC 206217]
MGQTLMDISENRTRSGFIVLAGRPNVGKSTLTNAIVGAKVAIVSDKPQTTRRAIRGVRTTPAHQLILVDLPGVQRPRDILTERMQSRVESELRGADAALMLINAEQGIGPGDRFIAQLLKKAPVPVVIAVNKIDRCNKHETAIVLQAAADLDVADEIFPISAAKGHGVQTLVGHLASMLPEGPFFFPPEDRSDQAESVLLAELVREQVLRRTRQEVPHAVEVEVGEIDDHDPDLIYVRAVALVETESQKGILIGAGGRMIRAIGTAARRELERELGTRVHLDLTVRVRKSWRTDERLLDRLGIE